MTHETSIDMDVAITIRTWIMRIVASDPPGMIRSGSIPSHVEDWIRMGGQQLRDEALRMLEARGRDMKPQAIDRVEASIRSRLSADNPNLDGEYVARRMLITESDEYRSAFMQAMTQSNPLYTDAEIRAVWAYRELETRALGENVTTAGGFGVPTTLDPSITLVSGAAAAPVWDAADVTPVTSNIWKGVTSAPPTFTFQTEAAVTTDASTTLAQPTVTVHMARAFIPYSIEVGQDYPGFASEIEKLLAQGWTDSVPTKTITGTGTNEPWGIPTSLDATAGSEVRVTTAGTVDGQQIFRVWNAPPERFRTRAKWLMSVSQESNIRSFGAAPVPSSYFTVDLTQDGITD
jgi:HK97 family phage major capsid protein